MVVVYLEEGTEGLRAQLGPYANLPLALLVTWAGCAAAALTELTLSRYRSGVVSYMVVEVVAIFPMFFLLMLLAGTGPREPLFYIVLLPLAAFVGALLGVSLYARAWARWRAITSASIVGKPTASASRTPARSVNPSR
jgi:Kef-type K+ transport system membrane component KefB